MRILVAIMMFVGSVGTWRAMRGQPGHSGRATLKILGALVGMLGVTVAIVIGVTGQGSSGGSPDRAVAQTTVVLGAIFVMVMGLAAFALRVSEGAAANVPSSARARAVDFHRRRLHPWFLAMGAALLAIVGTAVATSTDLLILPAALLLVMAGSVLVPLYFKAGRHDRAQAALLASPWVRWQYSSDAWEAWATSELARLRAIPPTIVWKRQWPIVLLPFVAAGGTLWVVTNGSVGEKIRVLIFAVGAMLILLVGGLWAARRYPQRQYRKLLAGAPEAYFGPTGLLFAGEYRPWKWADRYLRSATVSNVSNVGPPHLVLGFQVHLVDGNPQRVGVHIPIPAGANADLELLNRKLRESFPKATIGIVQTAS